MILKIVRPIFGDLLKSIAQFLIGKSIAIGKQIAKIPKYLLDRFDIAFVAVEQQFIAAGADADIEQGFEVFDVLILYAEKRVEALWREFEFF